MARLDGPPPGCRHVPARPDGRDADVGAFTDSEGLRRLLWRLHRAGEGAWREDAEAAALMGYVADRYAALAHKHGHHPEDAAAAAFEAMLTGATRTAADPWAVITVAVRITLIAQQRADGLLTSVPRARRASYSRFHDAERFADRDTDLADYHPALHTSDPIHTAEAPQGLWVVGQASILLTDLGWPASSARMLVAHICTRLADIGSRTATYEVLRRDKAIRAQLDVPHRCWIALLRATLGHPTTPGPLSHGILARLLAGESVDDLGDDTALVAVIRDGAAALGGLNGRTFA
ncbi:hypothetical protein [Euzebya sp.]|uniref:hypothetical protein n=1 Tax=Euzebya sp. TaxID=1971409 RepID=UPI0035156FCE